MGWSVETQTRPVYDDGFFWLGPNTYLIAHENAHQWFGDSVSVREWRDVSENEGFATYVESLWSEHLGEGTAAEIARFNYDSYPADDEFWQVLPGDPGPDNQFDVAVYKRGAMTLQALRTAVGDDAFFAILRTWVAEHKDGTATTAQFVALAERIAGDQVDDLFTTWLYTKGKPPSGPDGARASAWSTTTKPRAYDQIERTVDLLAAAR
jgi:aminopeptidase N